jgi:hypothetical protein
MLAIEINCTAQLLALTVTKVEAQFSSVVDFHLLPDILSTWISQNSTKELNMLQDPGNPTPTQPLLSLVIHLEPKNVSIPLIKNQKNGYWMIWDHKDYWLLDYWIRSLKELLEVDWTSQKDYERFLGQVPEESLGKGIGKIFDAKVSGVEMDSSEEKMKLEENSLTKSEPHKSTQALSRVSVKPDIQKFHSPKMILQIKPNFPEPNFPEWNHLSKISNFPAPEPPANYQPHFFDLQDKNLKFEGVFQTRSA